MANIYKIIFKELNSDVISGLEHLQAAEIDIPPLWTVKKVHIFFDWCSLGEKCTLTIEHQ
jgi:hypothetical protein